MKVSLSEELKTRRRSFLMREEELYKTLPFGNFIKIKDWDNENSTVIWEGTVEDSSLAHSYKIQIRYGWLYPDGRPNIYPVEPRIINQRHQMPNWSNPKEQGSLCYMPFTPDYWHAGLTCRDIIERAIKWFRHYETKTLEIEFAPPEIEIYFPATHQNLTPEVLAIDTLLLPEDKNDGSFLTIPLGLGKFSLIATMTDSQSSEDKINELIRLKNLILPNDWLETDKMPSGRWFRLKNEPKFPVPLNSTSLAKLLIQNGVPNWKIYALAKENPSSVALCYPTEVDKLHWLLFETKFSYPNREGFRKSQYSLKFNEANKTNQLKLHSLSQINVENIFRRVSGFQVEKLLEKKILLLGVGTLGSTVAEELIKCGLGALTILDNDTLEPGNVSRHRLGLNYLGQNKAESLKIELLRKNPFAKINALTFSPLSKPEEFLSEVESSDLVVSCLGNDTTELFVNMICRRADKPAVYCRSYLEGRFGEVILAREGINKTCLSCAGNHLVSEDCLIPRPPEKPYQELVKFDGGCGAAFLPASSVDLGFISLHCVRIALNYLQNKEKETGNYFIIRGREFDDTEYEQLVGEVRQPFKITACDVPFEEPCPFH